MHRSSSFFVVLAAFAVAFCALAENVVASRKEVVVTNG
jgi:hypothetical protein